MVFLRLLVALAVVLAIPAGMDRAVANPLPACEWEAGETVLGFYGSGLVAANVVAPDPDEFSPHALQLLLFDVGDPLPAAHVAHLWSPYQMGDVQVWIMYYVTTPDVAEWRLQGRWNDSLPDDPQGDDGDAGGVWLEPAPGWNFVEHTFPGAVDRRGLVVTIAPAVPTAGPIWIDMLVVSMFGSGTIQTPCFQWVETESRRLGEIKALFH